MRLGTIRVSTRLLGDLLHLPSGCRIEAVEQRYLGIRDGVVTLYLKGEGMPEVRDGDGIPAMRPIYNKDADGRVTLTFEEIKCGP